MMKVVIASNNAGKLKELRAMLRPLGFEAIPQGDLVSGEAEEPHDTFLENALAKARFASRATGLAALADDSGLVVPSLAGEPGVHSAYYAGREGDRETRDARNNAKLLAALQGRADRRAYYYCVLVVVRSADDPTPVVADGRWNGEIATLASGANGFGYDPLFRTNQRGMSAAELSPEDKNRLSHRGKALTALAAKLGNL